MPGIAEKNAPPALIVVFLRGAVDGLNVVVPHGDPDYYARRPNIAIGPPHSPAPPLPIPIAAGGLGGSGLSALDLDGYFGLHPSLESLKPLFDEGELALLQATGTPFADRSHFSSQRRMEVGGTATTHATGGWLGRYLNATARREHPAVRAVSVGLALDQSLAGADSAIAVANSASYRLSSGSEEQWRIGIPPLYQGHGERLETVPRSIFSALDLFASNPPDQIPRDPGASYPRGALGERLRQAAQYLKADIGIEAITLNSDGWDHHVNENSALPPLLSALAQGLTALRTDLAEHWSRSVLVLMSEFGRTVGENASGGTDHGRANMMMVLGGAVNGGRVYGHWPGLASPQLDPTGDLAITTDYRTVLAEILVRHMGMAHADLPRVFPGYSSPGELGLLAA